MSIDLARHLAWQGVTLREEPPLWLDDAHYAVDQDATQARYQQALKRVQAKPRAVRVVCIALEPPGVTYSREQRSELQDIHETIETDLARQVYKQALTSQDRDYIARAAAQEQDLWERHKRRVLEKGYQRIAGAIQNTRKGGYASAAARRNRYTDEQVRCLFFKYLERYPTREQGHLLLGELGKKLGGLRPNSVRKVLRKVGLGLRQYHEKKGD